MNLKNSVAIKFDNITFLYKKKIIFQNFSYEFLFNRCYLLKGKNGCGKTTLVKLMVKLIYPCLGRVVVNTQKISYLPDKINFPETIKVKNILKMYEHCERYLELYTIFNIKDIALLRIGELSKGQIQKLMILTALVENNDLYIFDEPLNGLDSHYKKIFIEEVKKIKSQQKTIIIISHQLKVFDGIIDNKVILNDKVNKIT